MLQLFVLLLLLTGIDASKCTEDGIVKFRGAWKTDPDSHTSKLDVLVFFAIALTRVLAEETAGSLPK